MRMLHLVPIVLVCATLFSSHRALAQFSQQGTKLVGTGAVGTANQGRSVSVSADGNTVIIGGPGDDGSAGAAWVWTRSAGVWTQQGGKLVGSGAVGNAEQGQSVSLSADGNTAIVGGPLDSSGAGAAWVWTRSAGVWTQQGNKLVGSGAIVPSYGEGVQQGYSVSLSADGTTAIVGGYGDNSHIGAAWVWTRSAGVWTQQGSKLVASEVANQGVSVSLSADGTTAIVGGNSDDSGTGAACVWTRSAGVWAQQGPKLVGSGAVGAYIYQGDAVSLSADGNTAIVGGSGDNCAKGGGCTGAAWVWTRSAGVWTQQGGKLVGSNATEAYQGRAVSLSGDGNMAIVGGFFDYPAGAAWVWTRSAGVWIQQGGKLVGSGAAGSEQGQSVSLSADATTAIVGGPRDDRSAGAAWVFTAPTLVSAWVPVASHAAGLKESQWRTDLGLLNPGAVTANVRITFFGSGGVETDTTYVAARSQSILTDVVGQLGASGSGSLVVVSDQPLKITSSTYNQVSSTATCYPNGTMGQDYPAVVASDGLIAGQSAFLAGLRENASYRCNIGLANVGSGAATVLVELFDGAGTKLTDYAVSLPAGAWKQETQPFKNKAGQTAMDRGYAKITMQSGSGVFGFASVVDNITNDPTTIAMQR